MQFEDHIDSGIHTSLDTGAPFNKAEGAKEKWINTGWWAKFIAIVFAVFLFFGLVAITVVGFNFGRLMGSENNGLFLIGFIILFLILAYWSRELWLFGNDVRVGIKTNNMDRFNKGLKHLKMYFIILACTMVLSLVYSIYTLTINPYNANPQLKEMMESQE